MSQSDDIVDALTLVVAAFESLEIRYYIGGSVASSYHGAARSTMDVDVVSEIPATAVSALLTSLGGSYYASESAIQDAIRRRSCFNLIHLPTSFKFDVFVSRDREFDKSAMSRAVVGELGETNVISVPIASAEDIVISKLEWFRLGGESSERQLDDIRKVLSLLGESADDRYLRHWATSIGVADLLKRLRPER
ncbi:hypothetical protein [Blastopirellula marina]|uniref:Uncharacterized protein n=1 Tax=Blastopirellula marina DSM 3645 TaxID=314230 RepID=A3ZW81_9BACT|nr:hypothetical protein [Blastopirellula marina]EAQ79109.1 hypothetical protein DSM3645_25839 [Blastopirellula marina DSM 3645]